MSTGKVHEFTELQAAQGHATKAATKAGQRVTLACTVEKFTVWVRTSRSGKTWV